MFSVIQDVLVGVLRMFGLPSEERLKKFKNRVKDGSGF